MKICPNCKASVIDTAKFCNKCRFNIKKYEDEQASAPEYCTECGAEIQPDSAFCTECGADVVSASAGVESDSVQGFNLDSISGLAGMANEQMYAQNGLVVENGVLTGYTGKKRTITVYGSIEEIYDGAFEGNQIITCVEIEQGIKSIGRKAFASCSSLIEINIPASCRIIYDDTFKGTALRTLILTEYKKSVVLACLSNTVRANIDKMEISDAVTKKDGRVYVNIELIEETVLKAVKQEEEQSAERLRRERARIEAEQKRKAQEEKEALYNKYNAGTVHKMGMYNHGNAASDIEWIVLERNGNKALLISKYIIDRKKFNEKSESICWERSSIRKWLNDGFYNVAFSSTEKDRILTVEVENTPNPQHGTSSGSNTRDKIFLLSMDEVKKYYRNDADTRCQVTLFAKNEGAYCDGAYFGYWWLRTAGQYAQNAAYVFYTGGVSAMGYDVSGLIFGVRPAMWISL